jgi:acyl-CoA thioesterase-1
LSTKQHQGKILPMQHSYFSVGAAVSSSVARGLPRVVTALSLIAAAVGAATQPAPAQDSNAPAPAVQPASALGPKCAVVPGLARIERPLPRFAFRLSGGLPIRVVAIGSSSTAGAGASSPEHSYPNRLEFELGRHFPGHGFTVVNRGVNGEEAADMVARFETAVIPEAPHLVLWQVGTNSLLRDHPLNERSTILHEGLERLKKTRADVVLIDPQFAPRVIAKGETTDATVAYLEAVAKKEKIGLFGRYAVMRHWQQVDGLAFDMFVSPDGLHMNDWSYACFAKWLGFAIAEAATRPTVSVAAPAR